jgi:transcription elongation factor Elf1
MSDGNWITSARSDSPTRRAMRKREKADEQVFCPNCGAELRESNVALCLCGRCGARVCEGTV